jgi:hypothetical protein
MAKTLYLLEMGMNSNEIKTDVKNYRVRVLENIDINYNGTLYNMFFEFHHSTHYNYRKTNKRTGEPLKKMVQELIIKDGLHIETEFKKPETDSRGFTWEMSYRNSALERDVWDKHLAYTKANILSVVNAYSIEKYDKVVLVEEETKNIINKIGGFREKDIIKKRDFQTEGNFYFKVGQWDEQHKVVEVIRQEWEQIDSKSRHLIPTQSCKVDLVTKTIVG